MSDPIPRQCGTCFFHRASVRCCNGRTIALRPGTSRGPFITKPTDSCEYWEIKNDGKKEHDFNKKVKWKGDAP